MLSPAPHSHRVRQALTDRGRRQSHPAGDRRSIQAGHSMSVTAPRPEAPLQLLHPLWCVNGGAPHADDDAHRGRLTCWQAGDQMFTLNRVRYGEPRYLDAESDEVDGNGRPAIKRQTERVELTLTDLSSAGQPEIRAGDLGANELQVLISLLQQQLHRLKYPMARDFTREACGV